MNLLSAASFSQNKKKCYGLRQTSKVGLQLELCVWSVCFPLTPASQSGALMWREALERTEITEPPQHLVDLTVQRKEHSLCFFQQSFSLPKSLNVGLHAEIVSGPDDASDVYNRLVHPLHVRRAAVSHWQAEDFWVRIRVDGPWVDTR